MLHPATLLLIWLVFALCLQWLSAAWLMGLAVLGVIAALVWAGQQSIQMLRRSRWLLVSLAVLYPFATPGEYLPGIFGEMGLTYEGLHQGGAQIGRLLVLLASLAVLHRAVGTPGLLAGLYCLLKPFPWREATVVRLMLVLDHVEQKQQVGWRQWLMPEAPAEAEQPGRLVLVRPGFHWCDGVVLGAAVGVLLVVALAS